MKTKQDNILPKSWSTAKVGRVLKTSSGGTPSTTRKDFWRDGTIPWINSGALKDDNVTESSSYITELGLAQSSAKLFPVNTVLIALTGSTTGKVGLLDFECATNQSVVGIYPSEYLDPKFLFYYLISIRSQIFSQAIGSAQIHINKGIIDETIIPVPPINHQKRVVEILKDVFQKIESIKSRAKEIELLETEAFNSFIYVNDELCAEVELQNFCKHRSERIGKNWKGKRLIGVSKDSGVVDLRISGKKSFEKYKMVYPGDFFYNPMRIDIGSIAIWEGNEIALTSPDYVVFSIHTLSPLLLLKFLKSVTGLSQINNNTQGSVRSRLYFKNLSTMSIPYCGENIQVKAQTILEGFKKMKDESSRLQNDLQHILSETYIRLFNGDLVKNEPYDEAGAVLVEKMEVEKRKLLGDKKVNEKIHKMRKTKNKVDILEFVTKNFKGKKFTFETLYNKSGVEYETLKADLYSLIDKKLVLEFDANEEVMYLKLK